MKKRIWRRTRWRITSRRRRIGRKGVGTRRGGGGKREEGKEGGEVEEGVYLRERGE